MRLQDRVAIVTGGGNGIGRAYALGLAAEGARVLVADLDGEAAAETARQIEAAGGQALATRTDVADVESTEAMARAAADRWGRIDILVNNAAIFATVPMSRVGFEEIGSEEWDRLMAVNVRGVWLCCRAVVPYLRRQGKGKIVNISSSTVLDGSPTRVHYVASKAAVIGLTRTLARELGDANICVNVLLPGSTLSEAEPTEEIMRMRAGPAQRRAFKRVQRPDDLVGTMVFLCSDDSDFITGQSIVCDGGGVLN
jgi:NAD(P)-dependent dehydrogenase (short-subunit alcohol dehydrogenase family)